MTQGPNPNTASYDRGQRDRLAPARDRHIGNALIQNWKNVASQNFYFGGYVQDDWRVTEPADAEPRAALRLRDAADRALRPDELLRSGRALAAGGQVPQFPNLRGGLVFVGVDGNSRGSSRPTATTSRRGSAARSRSTTRPCCARGYAHVYGPSYQQANGTVGPVRLPHREPVGLVASTASRRSGCCAIRIRPVSCLRRARVKGC